MSHDPIYFLSNYGKCKLEHCQCIDQDNPRYDGSWGGLVCPDWEPLGAVDMVQLAKYARETYKKVKNEQKI